MTTIDVAELPADADPGAPPFDDAHRAVKPVIAVPPFPGAVKLTLICALVATTAGVAGVSGPRSGTTEFDAGEGSLDPTAFVAVTVQL